MESVPAWLILVVPVLYTAVGRVVAAITSSCTSEFNRVFRLDETERFPDFNLSIHVTVAALWPISLVLLPFLLVAILVARLLHAMWRF